MPDETPTVTPGANGQPAQGQVPTPQGSPAATGQVPTPGAGDDLTPEQLRDALRRARDDAAKIRIDSKRLADLEKAESDRQAASLSETQKVAKRAEDAEAALKGARTRIGAAELKVAASAVGIIDADIAAALLGSKVEYDAAGEPTNVADLVKQLKADKPHLFTASGAQGQAAGQQQRQAASSGGTVSPGAGARAGVWTRDQINKMTPQEYAAHKTDILAAMARGEIR